MKKVRLILLLTILIGCIGAWLGMLWLEDAYREKPYSLIEDRLYLGGCVAEPPPGTTAVVNLCSQEDRYPVEARLWEPLLDGGKEPDVTWLRRVVDYIDAQRQAGRTVYVHCLYGMNRSGMLVAAHLMARHGWGRDQALAFVRSKRPQVYPNPALMRLLDDWEKTLQAGRATGG
jgi:hypothetical protein